MEARKTPLVGKNGGASHHHLPNLLYAENKGEAAVYSLGEAALHREMSSQCMRPQIAASIGKSGRMKRI